MAKKKKDSLVDKLLGPLDPEDEALTGEDISFTPDTVVEEDPRTGDVVIEKDTPGFEYEDPAVEQEDFQLFTPGSEDPNVSEITAQPEEKKGDFQLKVLNDADNDAPEAYLLSDKVGDDAIGLPKNKAGQADNVEAPVGKEEKKGFGARLFDTIKSGAEGFGRLTDDLSYLRGANPNADAMDLLTMAQERANLRKKSGGALPGESNLHSLTGVLNSIKNLATGGGGGRLNALAELPGGLLNALATGVRAKQNFSSLGESFKEMFGKGKQHVSDTYNNVMNEVKGAPSKLQDAWNLATGGQATSGNPSWTSYQQLQEDAKSLPDRLAAARQRARGMVDSVRNARKDINKDNFMQFLNNTSLKKRLGLNK